VVAQQAVEQMSEAGLEAIFMASRPMLLRFLRARLGDHHEAEDLLQDLWLKLRAIETGPIAEPRSYLFRMADNLVLDRRRSARRRARRDEAWTDAQSGVAIEVDDRPSAERTLLARDELRKVERILNNLPERTAAAFRLFRIEGKPQKTIAADFGITVSAVEKHLQKAYRAVLAAQMPDAEWEEGQRPHRTEGSDVAG
jgi:RNA polymerase sigma factor (sigma-70 family)